ncbi:MAG: DnaD domain protein [Anaerovoracaceae bacterium]
MKRAETSNEYLFDTRVENIFINEYMVSAPGDFVKVYLVALMFVDLGQKVSDDIIARTLSVTEDTVTRAWAYWADLGVIRRVNGTIEFVNIKEKLYGNIKEEREEQPKSNNSSHILDNKSIKNMLASIEKAVERPLSGMETTEILSWMDDFDAAPEVIAYGYAYCFARKKENVKYIGKVIQGWTTRGFKNVLDVEKFLKETDQRHYVYKRIMQALGFHRSASEEEKRIIDRWFDEFNFEIEVVLEACKKTTGISNPNINYINKVLENWYKSSGGRLASDKKEGVSKSDVMAYYEKIRIKEEAAAKTRKEEILSKYPRIDAMFEEIRQTHMDISKVMISGGASKVAELAKLRKRNEEYKEMINRMLTENNVPVDYMEIQYKCPICKDTGTMEDGSKCECYVERVNELSREMFGAEIAPTES